MVNKEKAAKRNLIRIRKTQNPQQVDFKRMRKHRKARSEYWAYKKPKVQVVAEKVEKAKPKKKAPKKKKEPELEVIEEEPEMEVFDDEPGLEVIEEDEEEPELEVIDEELEELYSYDDEILDDDELEE